MIVNQSRWTYPRAVPATGATWLEISSSYSHGRFTMARRIRLARIAAKAERHAVHMAALREVSLSTAPWPVRKAMLEAARATAHGRQYQGWRG